METRALITQVLMPRIRQLEEEVAALRRQTWPYVQAEKDAKGLRSIDELRDFFKNLDDDTTLELLRLKARLSRNPGLQGMEVDMIMSLRKNFCLSIVNGEDTFWYSSYHDANATSMHANNITCMGCLQNYIGWRQANETRKIGRCHKLNVLSNVTFISSF